jgi:hypothetical protein
MDTAPAPTLGDRLAFAGWSIASIAAGLTGFALLVAPLALLVATLA